MIAGLDGTLESRSAEGAIIKVGGVRLRVFMPTSTLSALGAIGEEVHLHTHLHLREDNIALYGFSSIEELELFRMLIGVTGVGPKAALAMLSAMNPSQLTLAIATGNIDLLSQVPGVGKKMASRLALELKGKLESAWVGAAVSPEGNAEVIAALTSLGYTHAEAASAVSTLPDSPELTVEDKIRLALQQFAAR
ncbi:MAG: Holliday junction branch migration protein RuvA [Dehalococcoidia bacterium]|nr:MAG: Holliday junction branch migration protein RuvA [Dehalococcoidia bacterium]